MGDTVPQLGALVKQWYWSWLRNGVNVIVPCTFVRHKNKIPVTKNKSSIDPDMVPIPVAGIGTDTR